MGSAHEAPPTRDTAARPQRAQVPEPCCTTWPSAKRDPKGDLPSPTPSGGLCPNNLWSKTQGQARPLPDLPLFGHCPATLLSLAFAPHAFVSVVSDMRIQCWAAAQVWGTLARLLGPLRRGQGCIRREGTSEAAPEAVRQAVGGGRQSGWGRLLSVANAIEAGTWREGDSGWA